MFYTLGPMISPIAGGLLIDYISWRAVFGFSLLMGAAILAGAYFIIWETRQKRNRRLRRRALCETPSRCFHICASRARVSDGFNTGAFFVAASSASFLMKETPIALPLSSLLVALFPIGFFIGNFVSSRVGGRASNEFMVLLGAILALLAVALLGALLIVGYITPLALFGPGFLITFAQGISLPYAQGGVIATMPRVAERRRAASASSCRTSSEPPSRSFMLHRRRHDLAHRVRQRCSARRSACSSRSRRTDAAPAPRLIRAV